MNSTVKHIITVNPLQMQYLVKKLYCKTLCNGNSVFKLWSLGSVYALAIDSIKEMSIQLHGALQALLHMLKFSTP